MILYSGQTINEWYNGQTNIIKVYRDDAVCYYKISGTQPTAQTPCFAVVVDITQYASTEFEDVFNEADGKWYKLNNLNEYEEYGIYGSGRTVCESLPILPSGYTEVEYIERTSAYNGYIPLGETFTDGTVIDIDFQMTEANGGVVIGDYGTNDRNDWRVFVNYYGNVNNLLVYDFDSTRQTYNTGDWSQRFHLEIGNYYIKDVDSGNYLINATPKTSFTRPNQMYLFHMQGSQISSFIDYGKVYSLKIYKNNTLVKDFVPCGDGNGNFGLYDNVSSSITQPIGSFTGGTPITSDCTTTYEGKLTIDDGYEYEYSGGTWVNVGEVSGSSRLPQGYTEVEYAENTTQAYINLDVYLNKSNFEVGYVLDGYPSGMQWGYVHQNVANGAWVTVEGNYAFMGRWSTNGTHNLNISAYTSSTQNTIIYNNSGVQINGTTLTKSLSLTATDNIETIPLYFFARYDFYKNGLEYGSCKFKSFYLKNNGTLVRDMIPCYRNNDNMVGMYDLVNDVFYYPPNYTSYQLVAGPIASGTTVYPLYYDEKADPPNNLIFSSMTEAEGYECPWVGMEATIDGAPYVFSGDSQSGYEWVEKTTAWYTLQDLINTHTVVSIGSNKYRLDPPVNGIAYFRVHTDKVGGSNTYVDMYNDNLPSPPYFGIKDDSNIGLYQSVDGYSTLKAAANSSTCTWAYWIDENTIEVNAQAVMNDTMYIGFYIGSFSKLLLSFLLPVS